MTAPYFLGLDLGQAADYTALAVLERSKLTTSASDEEWSKMQPPPLSRPSTAVTCYHCRHLERYALGTPYPQIVAGVDKLLRSPELAGSRMTLAVDETGVGAPVVDLLREADLPAELRPITITGGNEVHRDGGRWSVPKRDLVSTMQVLLQSSRLKVAASLPRAELLINELLNFQVKITPAAHETYGAWREGTHDDLVLAVALAAWVGEMLPDDFESFTPWADDGLFVGPTAPFGFW